MQTTQRRAAIYARFSTDLQSDRSIEDQIYLCREFAEKQRLTVTATYSDHAKTSASIIGRDGLLDLMAEARAGAFEILIVEALDRISRDQEDLAGLYKRLEFAGIEIFTVHDGRADPLKIGLHGIMGEMFLRGHKGKVRRGMSGVVRDGRNAGGRAYGYAPIAGKPGELSIVPAEADIIRRIFAEYLSGQSPRQICADLNSDGIAPPRGTRWNASTINGNGARGHGLLLNPLYNGKIVWNRVRMVRNPETGRRISRPNPESEWKMAEAPELRIVDAETFQAVAEIKARRRKQHKEGRSERKPRRIFSGLLKCATCGGGMSIKDRRGRAVRVQCATFKESRSCDNAATYRIDIIEREVLEHLSRQLAHPELLKEYVRAYREERRRLSKEAASDRTNLERAVTRTEARRSRLVSLYADGVIDGPGAKDDIRNANEAAKAAVAALAQADLTTPAIELHPQAVEGYAATVDRMAEILSDPDVDPDQNSSLFSEIRKLIAAITIHPDIGQGVSITITGHLSEIVGEPVEDLGGISGSGGGT